MHMRCISKPESLRAIALSSSLDLFSRGREGSVQGFLICRCVRRGMDFIFYTGIMLTFLLAVLILHPLVQSLYNPVLSDGAFT